MPAMIKDWRQAARKSRAQVAQDLGVSKTSVSNWELGQNEPAVELLLRMAASAAGEVREFFLQASAEKSGMTGDAIKAIAESRSERQHAMPASSAVGFVGIPLVAVVAGAGEGRWNEIDEVEGLISLPRDLVPNPSETKCIRVDGDSMSPTISSRSIVAVDATQRRLEKLVGRVVVARHAVEGNVIKRVAGNGSNYWLRSDNTSYRDIDFQKDWEIVGRVIWWVQTA